MEIELFFPPNLSSYSVWLGSWGQAHPKHNSTGAKRATPLIRAEHRSKHLVPYIWQHKRIMLYLFPFQSEPHFHRSFEMLMSQTAFFKSKYSKYNTLLKLSPCSSSFLQTFQPLPQWTLWMWCAAEALRMEITSCKLFEPIQPRLNHWNLPLSLEEFTSIISKIFVSLPTMQQLYSNLQLVKLCSSTCTNSVHVIWNKVT